MPQPTNVPHNAFMASMYFFVPLFNLKENKKYQFYEDQKVNVPQFIHRLSNEVHYVQLSEDKLTGALEGKEQTFLYTDSVDSYEIEVKVFLLRHSPDKKSNKEIQYFLVIGTDIDKYITTRSGITRLLTEVDIIKLKKAFFENGSHQMGSHQMGTLTSFVGGKSIYEWIKYKLSKVDDGDWNNFTLTYSLIDIRVQQVKDAYSFNKGFYLGGLKTVPEILGSSYSTFVYGLLHTNENYSAYDPEEIEPLLPCFKGTPKFERFYAINGNLVFIRTHYPFSDTEYALRKYDEIPFIFAELPNILEMCIAISTDLKLAKYDAAIDGKYPTRTLRKRISESVYEMTKMNFHVRAMDDKMRFIFDSWGLFEWQENINTRGNQRILAVGEKRSRLVSAWGVMVAVFGVIVTCCSVYLTWHSETIKSQLASCNCQCEGNIEHTVKVALSAGEDLQTCILLLIIFICILFIIGMVSFGMFQYHMNKRN